MRRRRRPPRRPGGRRPPASPARRGSATSTSSPRCRKRFTCGLRRTLRQPPATRPTRRRSASASAAASAAARSQLRRRRGTHGGARSSSREVRPWWRVAGQELRVAEDPDQQVAVGRSRRGSLRPPSAACQSSRGCRRASAPRRPPWRASRRSADDRRPSSPMSTPESSRSPYAAGAAKVASTPGTSNGAPCRSAASQSCRRVLGVEPHLDRVPARLRRLRAAARAPSATAICSATRSRPNDALGDRVLDLQAGVHLQEVEPGSPRRCRVIDQELDRARADVADRLGGARAASSSCARSAGRSTGGDGRLLDRPSGAGAAPSSRGRRATQTVPWVSARTCTSMCRPVLEVRLDRTRCRRRTPRRLAPASASCAREVVEVAHDPHAAAAAAGGRLDQHGKSVGGDGRPGRPARTGTPASAISCLAAIFEPIASIASGGGPTQVSPASSTGAGEVGVLGQEAVAGVDGVGTGAPGRLDERSPRRYVSAGDAPGSRTAGSASRDVRRVGVGVGEHGDGRDAERRGRCGTPGGRSRRGWRPAPT